MSVLKKFFKDTILYGLATVLPRLMNFILVPLHTDTLDTSSYSDNTYFYVYAAFFNVILAYGMETSFFRFFSTSKDKSLVFTTTLISITVTTILAFTGVFIFSAELAEILNLRLDYFYYLSGVLALDALVIAPFAYLRATGRPIKFTAIKMANILVYVVLNFFFLWAIPKFNLEFENYTKNGLVKYIFISNLAASAVTFLLLCPYLFRSKWRFDVTILKQLLNYGWPIMVAGLAYVINENFDKWLLPDLLGKDINGAYSGCYKIAVFMTIFIQAFRLGAEPFFFNYAKADNAKKAYAIILKYFVIAGCIMFLIIVGYLDLFKELIVRDESYWIAIDIVPIVLLANLFLGIYFNLSIWYKLTDRTRYGMYISVFGAAITIAFNIVMIPKIGFMASAWATLAAYGTMTIISYVLGQKYYKVNYDVLKITFYLLLAIGIVIVAKLIEMDNYVIPIISVLIFAITAFILERNELKELIRKK